MSIVANLMRAMKPKILESFKDYNAQKEFLAKIKENKHVLVILKKQDNTNVISSLLPNLSNNSVNLIKVYQFQKKKNWKFFYLN